MKNFVDHKWLKDNMVDKSLIILDARAGLGDPQEGINAYNEGHIKGAHFVSMEEVMTGELATHGGRHPLPDVDKFVRDMENLGIGDESKVIIYDDGNIAMAARLWWLLKYIGKEDVFILKGGIRDWEKNGGALSKEASQVKSSGSLSLNIQEEMKVDMEEVKEKIDNPKVAIVDARAYQRYIGEVEPLDKVAGHLPNSLNYPWNDLVKDGELLPMDEINNKLEALRDYDEVIVHCGSGITGIVNLLLMEEVDIDSRLYAGGYSDWISYDDNEIINESKDKI